MAKLPCARGTRNTEKILEELPVNLKFPLEHSLQGSNAIFCRLHKIICLQFEADGDFFASSLQTSRRWVNQLWAYAGARVIRFWQAAPQNDADSSPLGGMSDSTGQYGNFANHLLHRRRWTSRHGIGFSFSASGS